MKDLERILYNLNPISYNDYLAPLPYTKHKNHWHDEYDKKYDERQKEKHRKRNKISKIERRKQRAKN